MKVLFWQSELCSCESLTSVQFSDWCRWILYLNNEDVWKNDIWPHLVSPGLTWCQVVSGGGDITHQKRGTDSLLEQKLRAVMEYFYSDLRSNVAENRSLNEPEYYRIIDPVLIRIWSVFFMIRFIFWFPQLINWFVNITSEICLSRDSV